MVNFNLIRYHYDETRAARPKKEKRKKKKQFQKYTIILRG